MVKKRSARNDHLMATTLYTVKWGEVGQWSEVGQLASISFQVL